MTFAGVPLHAMQCILAAANTAEPLARRSTTFMTTAAFVRLAYNPVERLYDALVDPARSERVMGALLVGYAAVWSLYGVVAKGSQDLHYDMGEMYA
jgi:hypothetical protein